MALADDHRLGQWLAGVVDQRLLRIERVDLADATAHKKRDDRLRPRLEVRVARRERVPRNRHLAGVRLRSRQQSLFVHQVRERQPGDPAA